MSDPPVSQPQLHRENAAPAPSPCPTTSHLGLETWAPLASFSPSVINSSPFKLSWELFFTGLQGLSAQNVNMLDDRMIDQIFLVLSSTPFVPLFITCRWAVCTQRACVISKKALSRLYADVFSSLVTFTNHVGHI